MRKTRGRRSKLTEKKRCRMYNVGCRMKKPEGGEASLWGQSIGFWQAGACQPCLDNSQVVNIICKKNTLPQGSIQKLTCLSHFRINCQNSNSLSNSTGVGSSCFPQPLVLPPVACSALLKIHLVTPLLHYFVTTSLSLSLTPSLSIGQAVSIDTNHITIRDYNIQYLTLSVIEPIAVIPAFFRIQQGWEAPASHSYSFYPR